MKTDYYENIESLEVLSRKDIIRLFKDKNNGDFSARQKLIEGNLRMVIYRVNTRFNSVDCSKEELISIGNIGLIMAVDTYDISKKIEFSTYAIRCIDNEICMFLRKLKKRILTESFEKVIYFDNDNNEVKIKDLIKDDVDTIQEYEDKQLEKYIHEIVLQLKEREREIISLYFGFNGNERHTQAKIAKKLGISNSYVSTLIRKTLQRIKYKLVKRELVDFSEEKTVHKCKTRNKGKVY